MMFIHLIPKPIIALTICSDANLVAFQYFGFKSYSNGIFSVRFRSSWVLQPVRSYLALFRQIGNESDDKWFVCWLFYHWIISEMS